MADEARTTPESLIESMGERPYRYDFYALARQLECMYPDSPRIGTSVSVRQDVVRFGQEPTVAFPPSSIASIEWDAAASRPEVMIYCFGVFGANGPLPLHLTEYARQRATYDHDHTLRAFVDMFHHRMIGLFYRAWASSRPTVSRDRRGDDAFRKYVGSLAGIGSSTLEGRDAVPDDAKRFHTGRLACQTKSAAGLESILSDDFGVETRVCQFVGRWMELPADNRCMLGASPEFGMLGRSVFVGARVWDSQSKFRVRLGPLSLKQFESFFPGTERFKRLRDWVRCYLGRVLKWDIQLVLRAEDVPATQLGSGARLGWTTWIRSEPFKQDADNTVLESGDA